MTVAQTRAGFIRLLLISSIAAYGLSFWLGRVGLAWQRAHDLEGSWLLPVNLPTFYFLPILTLAALSIARSHSRPTAWLGVAAICAVVFSTGRIAFWKAVALRFDGKPSLAQVEAASIQPASLLIGALGLLAWVALGAGLLKAASLRVAETASVASSTHVAG